MGEIRKRVVAQALKQSARPPELKRVPAHMRNSYVTRELADDARQDAETEAPRRLLAPFEQALKTTADAEKRTPPALDALPQRLAQAEFVQGAHHLTEVANPRENDPARS